jgi:hypothetical protein
MTARAMKMRLKVVEQEELLEKDAGHQGDRQEGGEIFPNGGPICRSCVI